MIIRASENDVKRIFELIKSRFGNVSNTTDSAKNVASAAKLTTARTITISGDLSGSTSFDGSQNVSISATVKDDSHNHVISNIDGLQDALNGKLSNSGTAAKATADANGQNIADTYIKSLSVSGKVITYTKGDGGTGTIITQDTNTTYSAFKGATASAAGGSGLVPAPAVGASNRYLRSDGSWAVPPDTNTTYSTGNATTAGITKLYTSTGTSSDGTMTRAAITTALNGKAASFDEDGEISDTD